MRALLNGSSVGLFGLMAGFFYAFSVCVMGGLDRAGPATAISAMQAINEAVRNPVFFVTFFLTPVVAIGAAAVTWMSGRRRAALLMGAAAAIYAGGALALTAAINVPMNEALSMVDPQAAGNARIWSDYSADWTFWNTVRTGLSTVALVVFAAAMAVRD